MAALNLISWPLRLLVNFLAFLGATLLIVFVLGLVFTYLSWLFTGRLVAWIAPALIIAVAVFAVVRLVERKRTKASLPLSETEQMWTNRRKRSRPLAIWLAVLAAGIGMVGYAIPGVRRAAFWPLPYL